jgi:predicted GNAT family N-acyltransferase
MPQSTVGDNFSVVVGIWRLPTKLLAIDLVHHPQATAICTKFIVKRSRRGGPAAMKLISAMVRFGLRIDVKECYIDCIPALLPYYKALGFTIIGHQFFHRENGPSFPMTCSSISGPRHK